MVGEIGEASAELGEALLNAAHHPIGKPLPITRELFTADPPPRQAIGEQRQQE